MWDMQQKNSAAMIAFFNESARQSLATERFLHAETLIASIARMAGSLMYRTFNFDQTIAPGTAVLSEEANIYGPKLMRVMLATLQELGNPIAEENVSREYANAQFCHLSFKESYERLAPAFYEYCEMAKVSHYDAAIGAAVAAAITIHDCREALEIEKGAGIAVYGFVEGTKTRPYPLVA